jgi:PAS domain S-box-containing protein
MSLNQDAVVRLKAIFDAAVDGIIIINDRGIIEEVNPASCKLFGYDEQEIIGKNVSVLMPVEHSLHHNRYIADYQNNGAPKIIGIGREVDGKKKNGQQFPFWLAVVEVKLDNRTIFTGFIHDLSEIKNAQIRLKALNEELEKKVVERTYELENVINQLLSLNNQLEVEINKKIKIQNKLREREIDLQKSLEKERELGELKSRFVSMASHEFRTPLSTILSSVSLISRYTETDQQENRNKHINKVKSSVTHLTSILNDFLSMNKLEEGKIKAIQENFDAVELCEEVIEELQPLRKTNQTIVFNCEKTTIIISSDRKIIKNILINLLSNAIKYSNDDGTIECKLIYDGKDFKFSIKDNGIGIPDEDQKHLFDRFFRASNATNIEGTGLGLNIVKKYVEMLKGQITYESKLYTGTTFLITIPFSRQNPID